MSSDSIEQKMNDKKSSSRKSKRKKTGAKRLSEHYDASESALLEAKVPHHRRFWLANRMFVDSLCFLFCSEAIGEDPKGWHDACNQGKST